MKLTEALTEAGTSDQTPGVVAYVVFRDSATFALLSVGHGFWHATNQRGHLATADIDQLDGVTAVEVVRSSAQLRP